MVFKRRSRPQIKPFKREKWSSQGFQDHLRNSPAYSDSRDWNSSSEGLCSRNPKGIDGVFGNCVLLKLPRAVQADQALLQGLCHDGISGL